MQLLKPFFLTSTSLEGSFCHRGVDSANPHRHVSRLAQAYQSKGGFGRNLDSRKNISDLDSLKSVS